MARFRGDIYSNSLNMTTQLTILFPDVSNDVTPEIEGTPRVMYLLHGLGGNSSEWTRFSKLEYYAKKYNFIIIMPEVQRSFYTDTAYGAKYFTYLADELPQICKKCFNIPTTKENTFICGESMGGYGAVKIGLNRCDNFGGIGTLSGVLDFQRFINDVIDNKDEEIICDKELKALIGEDIKLSENEDLFKLLKKVAKDTNKPQLIQICGTEDFLYKDNLRFKAYVNSLGYNHTYKEWAGEHAWPFWDVAIQRVFQFFCGIDLEKGQIY